MSRYELDPSNLEFLAESHAALFLGAGSTIPSGAPSGAQLARHLQEVLNLDLGMDSLQDAGGILEIDRGREPVVRAIIARLKGLQPTAGLLTLPEIGWSAIYTTNYDCLIEKAYARCEAELTTVRSDREYSKAASASGTVLYKLHGCITKDIVFGDEARLVITEDDYDEARKYRTTLFRKLALSLASDSVVLVGYSLSDHQLKEEMKEAMRLKRSEGAPGRIVVVSFTPDERRAQLLERSGFEVRFGSIDDFAQAAIVQAKAGGSPRQPASNSLLPLPLRSCTSEVSLLRTHSPNPARMVTGAPATYADIEHSFTFERSVEQSIASAYKEGAVACVLLGVSGVGKTTAARRVLHRQPVTTESWEHHGDKALSASAWLDFAQQLRAEGRSGILLVDHATDVLPQVNRLCEGLSDMTEPPLKLLLTAERSLWLPRQKSPALTLHGKDYQLGRLDEAEVDRLVHKVDNNSTLRGLVDQGFLSKSSSSQRRLIHRKCSDDMFVALKYIFSSEKSDVIILREFRDLAPELQETYRLVAILEAAGVMVHRQLTTRMLGIDANLISAHLHLLEGIVDETATSTRGVFVWQTRHPVVAHILARYKADSGTALTRLLLDVAKHINPTIEIERRTAANICNGDLGIRRLNSFEERMSILRAVVDSAPDHPVPRHAIVRELIRQHAYDEAEVELDDAVAAVREDASLRRYRALLTIRRAEDCEGFLQEDRVALLREARAIAAAGVSRNKTNKHAYRVFDDLAHAAAKIGGEALELIPGAVRQVRCGAEITLDPQLARAAERLERRFPVSTE